MNARAFYVGALPLLLAALGRLLRPHARARGHGRRSPRGRWP